MKKTIKEAVPVPPPKRIILDLSENEYALLQFYADYYYQRGTNGWGADPDCARRFSVGRSSLPLLTGKEFCDE